MVTVELFKSLTSLQTRFKVVHSAAFSARCKNKRLQRKQNFDIVFGFKSSTTLSTFTFCFLSFPLFSLSLPHFFFQLAGHLVGFILVGRVSEKPFIILELGAQKGRWVMEQTFHGDFRSVLHGFFGRFSSFLD